MERITYATRVNRVVDYIEGHLGDRLELKALAGVAHFSPWHFHRIFQAITGEPLASHVRRRRLEAAALRLQASSKMTILSIALDVGFGSPEVLTRAFNVYFGMTPGAWRRGGSRAWIQQTREQLRSIHLGHNWTRHDRSGLAVADSAVNQAEPLADPPEHSMSVVLKTQPPYRLAYMRRIGPYGDPKIGQMWEKFMHWCGRHDLLCDSAQVFGIAHDSADIAAPRKCRYDACIAVDQRFFAQGDVGVQDIGAGLYACVEFVGRDDQIYDTWLRLYGQWLPSSGYQPDDRPALEAYGSHAHVDPATGVFRCELQLPIRPL